MRYALTICCLLSAVLLGGCQTAYVQNRKNDLLDCVRFSFGKPVGLHVGLKVTDFATFRFGYSTGIRKGYIGRNAGMWNETEAGLPLILSARKIKPGGTVARVMAHTPYELDELTMFTIATKNDCWLNAGEGPCQFKLRHWIHLFDIELGGTVAIVSGRIGFSPGEFLDLLCGLVGFDLAKDDENE